MTIIEALKENDMMLVSYDNRWLIWNEDNIVWQVYERKPYPKRAILIYSGASEAAAVEKLREG